MVADGRTGSCKVGDAVQNLGQVRVGDTIEGTYEDRRSFALSEPDTATPRDRDLAAGRPGATSRTGFGCPFGRRG